MQNHTFIKYESRFFSEANSIQFLIIATSFLIISFFFNYYIVIENITNPIMYILSCVLAVMSVYALCSKRVENYIYLTDEEIWFKEDKLNKIIRIKYDELNYVDASMKEIIFCTKAQEKMVLKLSRAFKENDKDYIKNLLFERYKMIQE